MIKFRDPGLLQESAISASVLQGDSYDLVREVGDSAIDLILTSPPYWGLRSYGFQHDEGILEKWENLGCDRTRVPHWDWYRDEGGVLGLEPFPEWYIAHLVEFFQRARRTIKPSGSVWINIGDTYFARWSSIRDSGRQGIVSGRQRRRTPAGGYLHDKQLLMIPARFAIAMQDAGWILRNDLIWAKPNPMPRPERDRLRLSHEHWFHFVHRSRVGRPSYYYDLEEAEENGIDVVSYAPVNTHGGHSATFPSSLVARRIRSTCPVGGMVLDPFCGTGITITEAVRLGRNGLGFEMSPETATRTQQRVSDLLVDNAIDVVSGAEEA
jgi:DNA modification methylase